MYVINGEQTKQCAESFRPSRASEGEVVEPVGGGGGMPSSSSSSSTPPPAFDDVLHSSVAQQSAVDAPTGVGKRERVAGGGSRYETVAFLGSERVTSVTSRETIRSVISVFGAGRDPRLLISISPFNHKRNPFAFSLF